MRTLTPDQATLILTATGLPSLNAEHPVTKRVIAALPAEKADYRPDNIVRSAIDLAWHIVASKTRFLEAVASGAFDFSGAARPAAIRTPADVVDWYSERFAKDIDRMYLRPMGAKVPSIYGESYDAREAREKARAASG